MEKGDRMQKSCQTFNLEKFKNSEKRPFEIANFNLMGGGGYLEGTGAGMV